MSVLLDICHKFDGFTLEAQVEAGAGITAVFGPSGSGKTSLVRAVAGLLHPNAGRIEIAGRPVFDADAGIHVAPHKRRVGYVFQEPRLFPHMTVRQNLTYAKTGLSIDPLVEILGVGALLDRKPSALSGGEAQRVAIGRALLSDPDVLLMDEPLASLDGPRKAEILPYLERLRDEMQMPILYVSHDMSEVARLANSLILMGEGRVVQAGPAQDLLADPGLVPYLDPQEAGAVLSAKVRSYHSGDDLTELALSAGILVLPGRQGTVGDVKRVRVAAQDVILATTKPVGTSALNILPVTVTKLQSGRGPGVAVGLLSGTDELLARVTRRSAQVLDLSEGSELFAILKATAVAPRDVN